jgi:hypothetical protein
MLVRMPRSNLEDSVYATIVAFQRRYGLWIALLAPLALISIVPMGQAGVLLVVLIYLGEAIVYAGVRSRRSGTRKGPGAALQALWGLFAILLIVGGLLAVPGSDNPAPIGGIVIGVIIAGWIWARVARASGESSIEFLARIGRLIVEAVKRAIISGGP